MKQQYQYKDSQFNLTMNEVDVLINSASNFRNKLIIESLYYPALRRFEVVNLDVRDVDFDRQRIVIKGKFGKIAPIPVGSVYPQYMANLRLYIGKRTTGYVFESNRGKKLELSRLNQILIALGNKTKIKNPNPRKKHINPHLFRHSQARHLKNMGFSAEFIMNFLRHETIQTTFDTYGTLSIGEMENMALKMRGVVKQVEHES